MNTDLKKIVDSLTLDELVELEDYVQNTADVKEAELEAEDDDIDEDDEVEEEDEEVEEEDEIQEEEEIPVPARNIEVDLDDI